MSIIYENDTKPVEITLTTTDDYSAATADFNIVAPSGAVEERSATIQQDGTPPASTTVHIYIIPDGTFELGENRIRVPVVNAGEEITYPDNTCEPLRLTVCDLPDVTP